ncbi:MAG: hypothetical protein U5K51_10165 [Flavobacteriaceae bacterium]|nr:hypothetical protein [Flavobacteriaceae bacterium]
MVNGTVQTDEQYPYNSNQQAYSHHQIAPEKRNGILTFSQKDRPND